MYLKQESHLIGVWVPTFNWTIPDRLLPRLVFDHGRGFFEDGDYPAIYSVEHFCYSLYSSTVLEVTQSKQEFLNNNSDGTEFEESWIDIRYYDIHFQSFDQSQFLEIEISHGSRLAQYYKTAEAIPKGYQPKWKFE